MRSLRNCLCVLCGSDWGAGTLIARNYTACSITVGFNLRAGGQVVPAGLGVRCMNHESYAKSRRDDTLLTVGFNLRADGRVVLAWLGVCDKRLRIPPAESCESCESCKNPGSDESTTILNSPLFNFVWILKLNVLTLPADSTKDEIDENGLPALGKRLFRREMGFPASGKRH